ncbi:MAG: hypothetical protein ABJB74_18050 [Gemmatimonas sp.]
MKTFHFRPLFVASTFFGIACSEPDAKNTAVAANVQRDSTFVLQNGRNVVDLLGDGTPAEVFVAWRGNYNAHGFSTVSFSVKTRSDLDDSTLLWQVVPFVNGPDDGTTGRVAYLTQEGADCTLGDLRVIQHQHHTAEIVVAHRAMGESFADTATVQFYYYQLIRNTGEIAGKPPFSFTYVRTVNAKHSWCDVNTAFDHELHLGATGIGRGEGGR